MRISDWSSECALPILRTLGLSDTDALSRLQSTGRFALELEAVSRHFGALVALADINLAVQAGERRAVLGSNGAGKTPLFTSLTGDFLPTPGRVRLFREDVTRAREPPAALPSLMRPS